MDVKDIEKFNDELTQKAKDFAFKRIMEYGYCYEKDVWLFMLKEIGLPDSALYGWGYKPDYNWKYEESSKETEES